MKHSRNLFILLLSAMLCGFMIPSTVYADGPKNAEDIVVLFTNDTHCTIKEPSNETIGFEGVAGLRDQYETEYENVTLVDAGDEIQGNLAGTLSKGAYMVDIFNSVGYEFAVPGNHEFDYSLNHFLEEIVPNMNMTYLSCNFKKVTGENIFQSYKIVDYGTAKVAYLGICTPETFTKSTPAYFQDENGNFIYSFCQGNNGQDLYQEVQLAVNQARGEGADYVIALGHLGINDQTSPWTSVEVAENTRGIDAIIDGHSHSVFNGSPTEMTVYNSDHQPVIISQTGTELANIGKLTIDVSEHTVDSEIIHAADVTAVNESVKATVDDVRAKIDAESKEKIGTSNVSIDIYDENGVRIVRRQECAVGNLCADAYKAAMGTDVAIVQGGGVRSKISAGDVTFGDIVAINPWYQSLCAKKVTGQIILDALEFGASTAPDSDNGGFLQVSGITFEINTSVKSTVKTDANKQFISVEGERKVQNVKINGKDIDPDAYYTIGASEYLLENSGDGMTMFKDAPNIPIPTTLTDTDAVIKYIKENLHGVIGAEYGDVEGRIIFTDKKPAKDVSSVTLSKKQFVYNEKKQLPKVTVKDMDGKLLVKDVDYTVSYPSKSTLVGTYKVIVEGKGVYQFSKTLTYMINPKATKITKVKAKSKGFKVYWKKVSKQITGYQIRYSRHSSMSKSKIVTVKSSKTTHKTITKLSRKKKYYVQVRVYRTTNGKKYYSSWSPKKSVKTK